MRRAASRVLLGGAVVVLGLWPVDPARADNCATLTDCFNQFAAALAVVAAIAVILALVTMFPPGGGLVLAGSGFVVGGSVAVPVGVTKGLLVTGVVAAGGALTVQMAQSPGGGGDRARQNKQFREAVRRINRKLGRRLTRNQIDRLHREISKEGMTLDEIVEWGVTLFGG